MKKLILLAVLCVIVPFGAYWGKLLGFWHLPLDFDIPAHLTVSLGLAMGVYAILRMRHLPVSFLSIVIPVMLIGLGWEVGQMLLGYEKYYISNAEAIKDLSIDLVGAMIGAVALENKRG